VNFPRTGFTRVLLILFSGPIPTNQFFRRHQDRRWKEASPSSVCAEPISRSCSLHGIRRRAYTAERGGVFYLLVPAYDTRRAGRWLCAGKSLERAGCERVGCDLLVAMAQLRVTARVPRMATSRSRRKSCVDASTCESSRARRRSGYRRKPDTSHSGWRLAVIPRSWRTGGRRGNALAQRRGRVATTLMWIRQAAVGLFVGYQQRGSDPRGSGLPLGPMGVGGHATR